MIMFQRESHSQKILMIFTSVDAIREQVDNANKIYVFYVWNTIKKLEKINDIAAFPIWIKIKVKKLKHEQFVCMGKQFNLYFFEYDCSLISYILTKLKIKG